MEEIKAFKEALSLSMKGVTQVSGVHFSLESDVEHILKWVRCSGKDWATKRLKQLKVIALRILSDGHISLSDYHGKKTKIDGFEIPALRLFSILLKAQKANNWKAVRSVLDVLNVYMVFNGPGDDVEEKIDNIVAQPVKGVSQEYAASLKADLVKYFPLQKRKRPYLLRFMGPDIGGARYAQQPRKNSSSIEALIPSLSFIPRWIPELVPGFMDWIDNQPFLENVRKYRSLFMQGSSDPGRYWGGNLAILGEAGLKTRIVFVGNPWIQGCLKSTMVLLQRQLLKLTTDCTFSQDDGRTYVQEALRSGKVVHSIDLTAATDNFPFFLQRFVGELVGIPKWALDLMEYVGFVHPLREGSVVLGYGKGQPMGLYPSFPLFALTHNVLLHMVARKLNVDPNHSFRVLGDDVVITDDSVANEYTLILTELGVPVSSSKTFRSKSVGEFGGKVFWRGYDVTPIKWRSCTLRSLNVISQYIERGLVSIDPIKEKITHIPLADPKIYPYAEALYPLPRELGGFGGLTRLKESERLSWGRRNARSLRAGFLSLFSDRVYRFLSPQEVRGIDLTKFAGLVDQQIKFVDLVRRAREEGLKRPPGSPVPFIIGAPASNQKADLPDSREGLKGLESLVFSKDTMEERLGKYHLWYVARLGPNPSREFNRMITMTGEAAESLNVPVLSVSDSKALQARVRHLHPNRCEELLQTARERLELLRSLREQVSKSPDSIDDGVPWGKIAGAAGATLLNPVAGLLAIGAALLSEQGEDKPTQLGRLVPLLEP